MDLFSLSFVGDDTWATVALVLAIVAGVLGYFMFVKPEKKYPNKFVNWLRNYLNFQEMLIEVILKMTYIFFTVYIILTSFELISVKFLLFLEYLVINLVVIRIVYEIAMLLVGIWKNTKEINKKIK